MNYREAIEAGYEVFIPGIVDGNLASVNHIIMDRLMTGWQVVMIKSKYHDQASFIIMIKR